MAKAKKNKADDTTIVVNKKANHDFFIGDRFEAGIALTGWEVKSLRQKKIQLVDSHCHHQEWRSLPARRPDHPLDTASSHVVADPTRTRKLLLHKKELARIFSAIQQKGHTCVCTKLYWKGHLVKCQVALAKGKQSFDKRASIKEREWNIDKQRAVRQDHR